MAEFCEVMKQWQRMCEKHICAGKETNAISYSDICPITIFHNGCPCDASIVDCSKDSIEQVEQIVMNWAKEYPEPQYPTWGEWLAEHGVVIADKVAEGRIKYNTLRKVTEPIPADIAEKLGMKPKEANGDG